MRLRMIKHYNKKRTNIKLSYVGSIVKRVSAPIESYAHSLMALNNLLCISIISRQTNAKTISPMGTVVLGNAAILDMIKVQEYLKRKTFISIRKCSSNTLILFFPVYL